MAQKSSSVVELKKYTRIPEPKQREIWTPRKIEHLRSLGLTGRAAFLWDDHSDSLRVYDRLCFENIDPIKSNEEFQNNKENLGDSHKINALEEGEPGKYGQKDGWIYWCRY